MKNNKKLYMKNNEKLYKGKKLIQEAYFENLSGYEEFIDLVKFDLRVHDCDYAIATFGKKKEKILKERLNI